MVQSYEVAFIVRAALKLDEYLLRQEGQDERYYILNLRGLAAVSVVVLELECSVLLFLLFFSSFLPFPFSHSLFSNRAHRSS